MAVEETDLEEIYLPKQIWTNLFLKPLQSHGHRTRVRRLRPNASDQSLRSRVQKDRELNRAHALRDFRAAHRDDHVVVIF